jgi:hypothetical protein
MPKNKALYRKVPGLPSRRWEAELLEKALGVAMDILRRRERHKINKQNAKQRAREFIVAYLNEHHCVDCGESDPVVLTFDHMRGEKKDNISDMVNHGFGLETIKTEIEKCDVTCFNCHSLRTQQCMGSYRWRMGKLL